MHFLIFLSLLVSIDTYAKSADCLQGAPECLISHANKFNGVNSKLDGPNCWNTTLVASGILSSRRYVNDKEFIFYMNSPLCIKLNKSDKKITGDIGSIAFKSRFIRGAEGIDHAFVKLNGDQILSKKNPFKSTPISIIQFDDVLKDYELNKYDECYLDDSKEECNIIISYYRCQSLNNYLSKEIDISSDIVALKSSLDNLESELEKLVMDKILNFEKLQNLLLALHSKLDKIPLTNRSNLNEKNKILLSLFRVRIDSIIDQVRILKEDYPDFSQQSEKELVVIRNKFL